MKINLRYTVSVLLLDMCSDTLLFPKRPVSNDHLKSLVVLVVLKDINSSVMTTYSVLPVLHI